MRCAIQTRLFFSARERKLNCVRSATWKLDFSMVCLASNIDFPSERLPEGQAYSGSVSMANRVPCVPAHRAPYVRSTLAAILACTLVNCKNIADFQLRSDQANLFAA